MLLAGKNEGWQEAQKVSNDDGTRSAKQPCDNKRPCVAGS